MSFKNKREEMEMLKRTLRSIMKKQEDIESKISEISKVSETEKVISKLKKDL